jgi:hypothetical protein
MISTLAYSKGGKVGALSCLLLALLMCNCVGTETGNPSVTRHVTIALVLHSTDSSVAQLCKSECKDGGSFNIQAAWLTTDLIELLGCVGQDGSELSPIAWDLLHPQSHGIDTQIPEFCGFHLWTRLADASIGAIPTGLDGAALWVSGTRTDGTSVELRSTTALNFSHQDLSQPLKEVRLVLSLDAAAWLSGVDVNALTPDTDGIVHISPASNTGLLQQVEQQTGNDAVLRPELTDDGITDD